MRNDDTLFIFCKDIRTSRLPELFLSRPRLGKRGIELGGTRITFIYLPSKIPIAIIGEWVLEPIIEELLLIKFGKKLYFNVKLSNLLQPTQYTLPTHYLHTVRQYTLPTHYLHTSVLLGVEVSSSMYCYPVCSVL